MVQPGGWGVPGAWGRLCYLGAENIDRAGPLLTAPLGGGKKLSYCAFGLWYDLRKSPYKLLDTSAAGPASWNPAIWVLKLP